MGRRCGGRVSLTHAKVQSARLRAIALGADCPGIRVLVPAIARIGVIEVVFSA
jgi:hypothetical protein